MPSHPTAAHPTPPATSHPRLRLALRPIPASPLLTLALLCFLALPASSGQPQSPTPPPPLPEAPQPQPAPCPARHDSKPPAGQPTPAATQPPPTQPSPLLCTPIPVINWFARFLNGPQVKPLTPAEKARLAARNLLDPFNAVTILGTSAFSVGLNPQSAYGPGMHGFGKYVGVSYAQDLTGEFFGTFLIPSLVHQDPHYHRLPNAPIPRRIAHAIVQVVWTQGDNGNQMLNYANLAGFAIDDEISNLYVPGRETDFSASASRYAIGLATAPIDNFVTEFLPDVARHIHIRVVLIQRIINQVAKTGGPASP